MGIQDWTTRLGAQEYSKLLKVRIHRLPYEPDHELICHLHTYRRLFLPVDSPVPAEPRLALRLPPATTRRFHNRGTRLGTTPAGRLVRWRVGLPGEQRLRVDEPGVGRSCFVSVGAMSLSHQGCPLLRS